MDKVDREYETGTKTTVTNGGGQDSVDKTKTEADRKHRIELERRLWYIRERLQDIKDERDRLVAERDRLRSAYSAGFHLQSRVKASNEIFT